MYQIGRWLICLHTFFLCTTLSLAAPFKHNSNIQSINVEGDFRLRAESFDKKTPGAIDRHRLRYRFRLGAHIELPDQLSIGMRFASGTGEQVSTNQSFDNLGDQKQFWIDRIFLQWSPALDEWDALQLRAGKLPNPIWRITSSNALWDNDFNPEGFSFSFKRKIGALGIPLFFNSLQMIADEDSGSNADQYLFANQLGAHFQLPGTSRLSLAGAYYEWVNETKSSLSPNKTLQGNRRLSGVPLNEFGVAELTGEFSSKIKEIPLSLQITLLKNTRAKDSLTPKEDKGFQTGLRLGKAKDQGSWEVGFMRKRLETDATMADTTDSDFGDAGTNRKGNIFWAVYSARDWLKLKARYFKTQVVNASLSPGPDDVNRFQLECYVNF